MVAAVLVRRRSVVPVKGEKLKVTLYKYLVEGT